MTDPIPTAEQITHGLAVLTTIATNTTPIATAEQIQNSLALLENIAVNTGPIPTRLQALERLLAQIDRATVTQIAALQELDDIVPVLERLRTEAETQTLATTHVLQRAEVIIRRMEGRAWWPKSWPRRRAFWMSWRGTVPDVETVKKLGAWVLYFVVLVGIFWFEMIFYHWTEGLY